MAFIFPYIGNVIIPTDFHSNIFQRGRYTTNHLSMATEHHLEIPSGKRLQFAIENGPVEIVDL